LEVAEVAYPETQNRDPSNRPSEGIRIDARYKKFIITAKFLTA